MKKKLIEVALPLEAINEASARKKSIRHGHPSTLHLWWARRPLAAARAVIFAQMVDDPSTYVDVLRSDAKIKRKAESLLKARRKTWKDAKALAQRAAGTTANVPEPGPSPRRSSPTSRAWAAPTCASRSRSTRESRTAHPTTSSGSSPRTVGR
jgi:putative DNA methylase